MAFSTPANKATTPREYTDTGAIWDRKSKDGKDYKFLRITKPMQPGDYVAFKVTKKDNDKAPDWRIEPSKQQ